MEMTVERIEFSDAEIQGRVLAYLASRHFPAFRELDVDVDCGHVTLYGVLSSYHEKQVAINCCQRVAGVLKLIDEISVDDAV